MHENLINVGIVVFIIYAVISTIHIIHMWRTSSEFRAFLKNTEGNLNATLFEMKETFHNLKKITSDISTVSDEVRQITSSVSNLEKNIISLLRYFTGEITTRAAANVAGLKAGVKTGMATLVKTLKERRGDNNDGRTD